MKNAEQNLSHRAAILDGAIMGMGATDAEARHDAKNLYGARLPKGVQFTAASAAAFEAWDAGNPEDVDIAADGSVQLRADIKEEPTRCTECGEAHFPLIGGRCAECRHEASAE